LIHEGLLPEKEPNSLAWLQANFPLIEVMLICKGERPCYEGCAFMPEQTDQRKALMIFQDFFFGEGRLQDGAFKSENGLSVRELEILQAVAKGYSNKEIADIHFISINTVITHRKNITEKLGIKTIAGLTVYALMNKYVKPEEVKQ
jgi:DNA-binding CsgD family transcriptional regulator